MKVFVFSNFRVFVITKSFHLSLWTAVFLTRPPTGEITVIQIQAIQTWLQERQAEFLDDLRALVNIDCGTSNKTGVDAVGGLFRDPPGSPGGD